MAVTYNAGDLINHLIQLESCGAQYYSALAAQVDNLVLRQFFQGLAEQEKEHRVFYENLWQEANIAVEIDEDYHAYLQVILDEKFDLEVTPEKTGANLFAAIRSAMRLESDTLRFLAEFETLIGELHRDVLADMKRQEQQHLRLLKQQLDKLGA